MKIGLAGDWHGILPAAQFAIEQMTRREPGLEYIFQLGDFGIWPGGRGKLFVDGVQGAARRAGVTVFVTEGNHEDYNQIKVLPVSEDGLKWLWPNLALIPRGFRWELGGRSFVSLGGAPSVDFLSRTPQHDWWPEEMIKISEAEAVAAAGYADVMLAHDAPDGGTQAVQQIIDGPEGVYDFGQAGINYATQGRKRMNLAYAGVQPRFFAHGHFHIADYTDDGERAFLSLNCNGNALNYAILDLENWKVDWGF